MTTFDKLSIKIENDLGIRTENFYRTYAGIHEKSRGTFVWSANKVPFSGTIGSSYTATELLKKDKLEIVGEFVSQIQTEIM